MVALDRRAGIGCALTAALVLSGAAPSFAQAAVDVEPLVASQAPAPLPVAPAVPSLSHLFKDTPGDFRRLWSKNALTWLGIGASAALVARPADAAVVDGLSGSRSLHEALEAGQLLGGFSVQLGGALATYTIGRVTTRPQIAEVGANLLRAQIVTQAVTGVLKISLRRTRPNGTAFSFPSGHTSAGFASATVLQRRFGWKVGMPAYGIASYIAASRIQTRAHFPSDVAFGAALGIAAGRSVTVGHGRTQFAVAPLAAPGGGGAAFIWVGWR